MTLVLALAVTLLVAVGVELLLGRSLFRAILGLSLLAHAANLMVMASGGAGAAAAVLDQAGATAATADPLPQALVLTAIVISMALTLYLVGVLRASGQRLASATVEPALSGDQGRDQQAIADEIGSSKGPS